MWTRSFTALLVFLLFLSSSLYSEVILTDQQYNEIKSKVAELKKIEEDSKTQIEGLEKELIISEKTDKHQNEYIMTLETSLQKSTKLTVWEKIENFLNGFLWGGLITSLIYGITTNYQTLNKF